jgi:hypothetical protein
MSVAQMAAPRASARAASCGSVGSTAGSREHRARGHRRWPREGVDACAAEIDGPRADEQHVARAYHGGSGRRVHQGIARRRERRAQRAGAVQGHEAVGGAAGGEPATRGSIRHLEVDGLREHGVHAPGRLPGQPAGGNSGQAQDRGLGVHGVSAAA